MRVFAHINGVRYELAPYHFQNGVDRVRDKLRGLLAGASTPLEEFEVLTGEDRGSSQLAVAPQRVWSVMLEVVEDDDYDVTESIR